MADKQMPMKPHEPSEATNPFMTFDAAPKDIEIPTSHEIGDDIIMEEK